MNSRKERANPVPSPLRKLRAAAGHAGFLRAMGCKFFASPASHGILKMPAGRRGDFLKGQAQAFSSVKNRAGYLVHPVEVEGAAPTFCRMVHKKGKDSSRLNGVSLVA